MSAYDRESLVDLFHEVPRLWDFLDGKSLKTLLSTGQALRNQAMKHVHCIRTGSCLSPDMCHLTSSSWTRLQVLDLSSSRHLAATSTAQLELQRLSLGLHSDLNAGVVRSFSGKWPLLHAFSASRLDQAAMSELVAIEWPQLRELSIDVLDDSGLKHLRGAHWSGCS